MPPWNSDIVQVGGRYISKPEDGSGLETGILRVVRAGVGGSVGVAGSSGSKYLDGRVESVWMLGDEAEDSVSNSPLSSCFRMRN